MEIQVNFQKFAQSVLPVLAVAAILSGISTVYTVDSLQKRIADIEKKMEKQRKKREKVLSKLSTLQTNVKFLLKSSDFSTEGKNKGGFLRYDNFDPTFHTFERDISLASRISGPCRDHRPDRRDNDSHWSIQKFTIPDKRKHGLPEPIGPTV